jgi:hypothetical protein
VEGGRFDRLIPLPAWDCGARGAAMAVVSAPFRPRRVVPFSALSPPAAEPTLAPMSRPGGNIVGERRGTKGMYSPPEVRELGQVVSHTLGSAHGIPSTTKANNTTPDFYTAFNPANPDNYGVPCTTTTPIGNLDCSTP